MTLFSYRSLGLSLITLGAISPSCGSSDKTHITRAESSAQNAIDAVDTSANGECALIDKTSTATRCVVNGLALEKSAILIKENTNDGTLTLRWVQPLRTSRPLVQLDTYVGYTSITRAERKTLLSDFLAEESTLSPLVNWQHFGATELTINPASLTPKEGAENAPFVFVVGIRDGDTTIFYNLQEFAESKTPTSVEEKSSDTSTAEKPVTPSPKAASSIPAASGTPTIPTFELIDKKITKAYRTTNSITLVWNAAGQGGSFDYQLIQADTISSVSTVAGMYTLASEENWMKDVLSITLPDLTSNSSYIYNIIVRNKDGKFAIYTPSSFSTLKVGKCDGADELYHHSTKSCLNKISPDAVDGVVLDLDAAAIKLSDATEVSVWKDSSASHYDFTVPTSCPKPIYSVNSLNAKPTVVFNSSAVVSNDLIDISETGRKKLISLAVYEFVSPGVDTGASMLSLWTTLQSTATKRFLPMVIEGAGAKLQRTYFDQASNIRIETLNGNDPGSIITGYAGGSRGMQIGSYSYPSAGSCGSGFNAIKLSELILIDGSKLLINDLTLLRLEVYLALKWGLALVK